MTNIERLKRVINTSDVGLYKWLEDFANWHDPSVHIDNEAIKDYLESKCSATAFQIGDIIHLKESNIYGVVTYIDTELNWYCILMDSGKTLQHSCDFDTVEKTWEFTGRKLCIDNIVQSILPMMLRKEWRLVDFE
jgi:hypothetical protein